MTSDDSNTQEHEHQFVTPIEWKQVPNSSDGYGELRYIDQQKPIATKVTRLRCLCGEELNYEHN